MGQRTKSNSVEPAPAKIKGRKMKKFLCFLGFHKWIEEIIYTRCTIIRKDTYCERCGIKVVPFGCGYMIGDKFTRNSPVGNIHERKG